MSDISPLRQALDDAIADAAMRGEKLSMQGLTVLALQNDPFRLDTAAHHRDARWLADTMASLGVTGQIHVRGLHYAILGQPKPDGSTYINDNEHDEWLRQVSSDARWLGYIEFDQIVDQRNAEPIVRIHKQQEPEPYITVPIEVDLPADDDILPRLGVEGFDGEQPYRLVFIGEKSSLFDVLDPIASECKADLYLPSGDISNTHIYRIAKTAAEDGRPLVVLYFADCDPAGHHMGIALGRKLQAFKVSHFPELDFQVHRAALTVEQVREFGLPSTPLKASERRADKWREKMGVEQTEIDALATLRSDLLRHVARQATAPFFDSTLDPRVFEARGRWMDAALEEINGQLDSERLGRVRADAQAKLPTMREQIEKLNEELRVDVEDFDLPDIEVPEAELPQGVAPEPLIDSRWSFVEQTKALLKSKSYGGAS
jgi:hypothetical protein